MRLTRINLLSPVILLLLLVTTVQAAWITVKNTNDTGPGSLREAVEIVYRGDTILFELSLRNMSIVLMSGQITIDKDLFITGLGEAHTTITTDNTSRIFYIESHREVQISALTLSGGREASFEVTAQGGAIFNAGSLYLMDCALKNNSVSSAQGAAGGAIFNEGALRMLRCKLLSNISDGILGAGMGGGLFNAGDVWMKQCEISYNTATDEFGGKGGGILNRGNAIILQSVLAFNKASGSLASATGGGIYNTGSIKLSHSTLSGNSVSARGSGTGGLDNTGFLEIDFCTITNNSASFQSPIAGGISSGGTLHIGNTIIAGNRGTTESAVIDGNLNGTVVDKGYNLLGVHEGLELLKDSTNLWGTYMEPLDPGLLPLGNYGGLTPAHALYWEGPAINRANPAAPVGEDQRGIARPYQARADIGAIEYTPSNPIITLIAPSKGSVYKSPATVTLSANPGGEEALTYLHIKNISEGWRKLKLGYDSIHIYKGTHNVLLGGNNTLEITLKDVSGSTPWHLLQIRPNGSRNNPVSISPYISDPVLTSATFVTIRIPLSTFDPSIDFTRLTLLELPYSPDLPPFEMGISKIKFTGGTTPFLWFGEGKINNAHDGNGEAGQLIASLQTSTPYGLVEKVSFYNGSTKIGEDNTVPYRSEWKNKPPSTYHLTAEVTFVNGSTSTSLPVMIYIQDEELILNGNNNNSPASAIYPNPSKDLLTISDGPDKGQLAILDISGRLVLGPLEYQREDPVDISMIPPGVYILQLGLHNETTEKIKLVKQ